MKKYLFGLKATFILALVISSFAGCSEAYMDEINKDNSHTLDCEAKFIVPDIELRTAQNVVGGDFNTYFGSYVEYWTGVHNQLYNAELRNAEVRVSSTFNNTWGSVYENIRNAKIVIDKSESDPLAKAVGQIMLAYNAAVATDEFGDTPYSQVGDYVTYPAPVADSQEAIYEEVFKLLDSALSILGGASNTLSSYDFIYSGDATRWTKFANGLKARYKMKLIRTSADATADYNEIINLIGESFAGAGEQASIQYDGSNINPLFDFQWSRDAIASSTSMYKKLMDRKDPRASRVYFDSSSWEYYSAEDAESHLAPTGEPEEAQYYYCYDAWQFAEVAPVHLLSYHELLFLKAEAQCKLGKTAEAKATLKEAVEAAFANYEVNVAGALNSPSVNNYGGLEPPTAEALTKEDADKYFDEIVAAKFDENPYKEIMIQKYIAFWGPNGEAVETYNDVRRLKAANTDVYGFINAGDFPVRAPYGNDDVVNNPNIAKLYKDVDVFKDNVWWAK